VLFVPVMAIPLIVIAVPPLAFVSVMTCAALLVPTVCAANVKLVGENDAAVQVPVSVTVYVPALVVMTRLDDRWLMLVGLNVTLIVQLAVPASDVPQLFVCKKSVAFPPDIAMLSIVSAVAVPLVNVTTCGALVVPSTCSGKVREVGEYVTVEVPVPVRGTFCGLAPPLSVIVTEAVRAPMAVGVNVTVIVQLFFAAKDGVQVFVSAKSPELVPVTAILVKLIVFPAAALVSVITCEVLVVPTVCEANVRLVGDREAIVPTPVSATV